MKRQTKRKLMELGHPGINFHASVEIHIPHTTNMLWDTIMLLHNYLYLPVVLTVFRN